ncbi:hypothetical protein AB1046_13620 [Promicromonospora sp. Populi]|uniref:hypothetical protein n=1 Tax=Promicromonospora sp. Populi TaxID=3239420 RepID=UPI0034E1EE65
MRGHLGTLALLVGAVVLALSACSSSAGEPTAGSTVQLQADYPSYDTPGLIAESVLVVEGTAVATEPTVLTPRHEGDTPEENPLLGLSEEEVEAAMQDDDAVPATAVTFRVDVVHRGAVEPGQEVTIVQTGGVVDGVTYQVVGDVMLAAGDDYLLFGTDSFDGAFAILGGSAGTYITSGEGVFAAAAPETAPAPEFTSVEVASLTE